MDFKEHNIQIDYDYLILKKLRSKHTFYIN